jgi:hypothetical protein
LVNRFILICCALACDIAAAPVAVRLVGGDSGWELIRGGMPFYIRGAGGGDQLAVLGDSGGNSIRTWSIDQGTETLLASAASHGLTVTLGHWLGHERHGFSYNNLDQVTQQIERVRRDVLKYRGNSAVLLWALGNEMEGYEAGDNPAIWTHIETLAAMVKLLDPHHPTMTVIGELGGRRVEAIHKLCPSIDIIGLNTYGGAPSLAKRYRELGGAKPFVANEFGPFGPWEVQQDKLGLKHEASSTAKAAAYSNSYRALRAEQEFCLGSYAFLWGHKMEFTKTWFGTFLPTGERLAPVDVLQKLWSGNSPTNVCPRIQRLTINRALPLKPGLTIRASLRASDPDGDQLSVRWELAAEADEVLGGDFQANPPDYSDSIRDGNRSSASIRVPARGGRYRLYVFVSDGQGGAATANLPLLVEGPTGPVVASKVELPFVLYGDEITEAPFAASGWMGATDSIAMDEHCEENPRFGQKCLRVEYRKMMDWGGAVWQNPPHDWGALPGGYDLSDAKELSFWVRGAVGGERVKFGFGIIKEDMRFYDTARYEEEYVLNNQWQHIRMPLTGHDLSRIKSGFMWFVGGQGMPVTFFLDEIRYE